MRARRAGQAMVEYALILVMIAVVVIAILVILGGRLKRVLLNISTALLAGHAAGDAQRRNRGARMDARAVDIRAEYVQTLRTPAT